MEQEGLPYGRGSPYGRMFPTAEGLPVAELRTALTHSGRGFRMAEVPMAKLLISDLNIAAFTHTTERLHQMV